MEIGLRCWLCSFRHCGSPTFGDSVTTNYQVLNPNDAVIKDAEDLVIAYLVGAYSLINWVKCAAHNSYVVGLSPIVTRSYKSLVTILTSFMTAYHHLLCQLANCH